MSNVFDISSTNDSRSPSASNVLLAAALMGLLGAAGCGNDPVKTSDSTGSSSSGAGYCPPGKSHDAGAGGSRTPSASDDAGATYNNQVTADAGKMRRADFQKICDSRGGYVYVNAACAGSAMCKGLSLHDGVLWDHSCRGQNSTCAGVGCVTTPADKGQGGQDIYVNGPCGNCHADFSQVDFSAATIDYSKVDYTKFAIFYNKEDISGEEAIARFKKGPEKRTESIIAWGTQGFTSEYTPYSNMPTYYQKYSLAEIKRVADYVRTLTPFEYPTGEFGESPGVGLPDAAAPVSTQLEGGLPEPPRWP
ncbi:MAG TPA: hypothetical protein VHC69_04785 [Polyangiaceae bacterium]|nr:hypothetical protein [Polyangiaceae bacterium]